MTEKKVAILGAGFSGLTLAWALTKKNIPVEVFEASSRAGGMLGSKFDGILVEQAANALLASENVETLLNDIGVTPVKSGYRSNKRWIFRRKPHKLPLTVFELISGTKNFLTAKFSKTLAPNANESLADWSKRNFNKSFCDYLISPAFQGVYGAGAERLSASLILKPLFDKTLRSKKGKLSGSISANGGMQEIADGLATYLETHKVLIHKNSSPNLADLQASHSAVVVAASIDSARKWLLPSAPKTAQKLLQVPVLPLATVTLKFAHTNRIRGFGCLFPSPEKFKALGVLFNSDIFPARGEFGETWIIPDVESSDADLLAAVARDRLRLTGVDEKFELSFIRRWEKALPLYGAELESIQAESEFSEGLLKGVRLRECATPLYLTGNYLGVIGLAKILDYNLRLSERIKKELA